MVYLLLEVQKRMPTKKYTLNIEPVGDHLEVTIPEIGVTVATAGTTQREAEDAGMRAIIEHNMQKRRLRRRNTSQHQVKAS